MQPLPILNAMKVVIDTGHLGYPLASDAFYQAIHDYFLRTAAWDINTRLSVGQNEGVYLSAWNILDTFTKPGDKVTILTPVHFCFRQMLNLNNRVAIECPLLYDNGKYTINFDYLEFCLSSGSKICWICNPHNPVGRVWTKEELLRIGELCIKYGVLIMSDDVYCGLTFPSVHYTPIASLSKEISYRTITMYSTSKSYNTTGLRHSFVVTENPELFKQYNDSMKKIGINYDLFKLLFDRVRSSWLTQEGRSSAMQMARMFLILRSQQARP